MKKIKKIFTCLIALTTVTILPTLSASAHDLGNWADYYTAVNANGNDNFGIMDSCHINGRTAYYRWENNTAKNYFSTALLQGENAWGGMIKIAENSSEASFVIKYNPNIASDAAAYVTTYCPSYGHYAPNEIVTEMVIGNITNYSAIDKKKVLTHELGHLWGIDDLYTNYTNLQSIYSDAYAFNTPTRHDMNAMYIGQDRPWYKDASGNWKFLKSPGNFTISGWAYTIGNEPTTQNVGRYYFGGNGVFVSNADSQYKRTYKSYSIGSIISKGQTLSPNQYLSSPNKKFIAIMQDDGDFAVYNTDKLLWSTGTSGKGTGSKCIKLQPDGNIVVYDSTGTALWSLWWQSGVNKRVAVKLAMQDDGNLVAYDSNNSPIWSTGVKSSGIDIFNVIRDSEKKSCLSITGGAKNIGTTLNKNQTLQPNQYLSSVNKKFIAIMKSDGNLAVYNTDGILWSSNTRGKGSGSCSVKVQPDGNIVMYDSNGKAIWHTWNYAGVNKHESIRLVMQDDGNLVAYSSDGTPVWWTNTAGGFGSGTFNIN